MPIKKIKNALLLLSFFIVSCNEQNKTLPNNNRVIEQTTAPKEAIPMNTFSANTATEIGKHILCIFQDKKNNYWFGTNGQGAYRYNGKTLIQFTVKDGLCDNQINAIQEDKLGDVWFGTISGVSRFDGKIFTKFPNNRPKQAKSKTHEDMKIEKEDLLFEAGGGAYRYDGHSFSYLLLPNSDLDAKYVNPTNPQNPNSYKLNPYSVYCSLKDRKGHLWFGTQALGVCRYDGKSFTWFREKGLSGPAVLALFEDRNGILWFGNNGKGLFRYDGTTLTNVTEEKGLGNPDFLKTGKAKLGTLARVWAINEDSGGNLWVGTGDTGVWRHDGIDLTNYTTRDGFPNSGVETIYTDKKGALWFGTDGAGVFKFDGISFSRFHY